MIFHLEQDHRSDFANIICPTEAQKLSIDPVPSPPPTPSTLRTLTICHDFHTTLDSFWVLWSISRCCSSISVGETDDLTHTPTKMNFPDWFTTHTKGRVLWFHRVSWCAGHPIAVIYSSFAPLECKVVVSMDPRP